MRPCFAPIRRLDNDTLVAVEVQLRGMPDGPFATAQALRAAARAMSQQRHLDKLKWEHANSLDLAGFPALVTLDLASVAGLDRSDSEILTHAVLVIADTTLIERPADTLDAVRHARSRGKIVAVDGVGGRPQALALLPLLEPDVIILDPTLLTARTRCGDGADCARSRRSSRTNQRSRSCRRHRQRGAASTGNGHGCGLRCRKPLPSGGFAGGASRRTRRTISSDSDLEPHSSDCRSHHGYSLSDVVAGSAHDPQSQAIVDNHEHDTRSASGRLRAGDCSAGYVSARAALHRDDGRPLAQPRRHSVLCGCIRRRHARSHQFWHLPCPIGSGGPPRTRMDDRCPRTTLFAACSPHSTYTATATTWTESSTTLCHTIAPRPCAAHKRS